MSSKKGFNRRDFLRGSTSLLAGTSMLSCNPSSQQQHSTIIKPVRGSGPASNYVPTIKAAFVRRKENYGMWWPGEVFDGQTALQRYTRELIKTAETLGIKLDIRPKPIYSNNEADKWFAAVKSSKPDGQIIILLDRQQHSWPTAHKATDIGIPTVIFTPLGTSFTTNTVHLAEKKGCVIYSHTAKDTRKAMYAMKLLEAIAKMRQVRCIVIKGNKRCESEISDLGINLRYLPESIFLEEYHKTAITDELLAMADEYMKMARKIKGPNRDNVINGIKSYLVAQKILLKEKADAITMNCLGAIGKPNLNVSFPCIAWSRMNDDGIPAACEADIGAVASNIVVQYLFSRPGFQQDL